MASPRRLEKLNMLLKDELAKIINREIDFSAHAIVTITHVRVSPDLHYALAYISVLGTDEKGALDILKKSVYDIQRLLNKKFRMRPVPAIRFVIDEGELRRERVEESLAELKRKKEL